MKGIGILLIIFHNFFHWVIPNARENEFYFSVSHVKNLLNGIIHTPFETINLLFSYFGFYGIVLFFFVSAYGLTISYRKQVNISYLSFIETRILKLYPAFLGAIIALIFWSFFVGGSISMDFFKSISYKLLLISNFITDEALSINGPWWFFVCIMQFYLVFPLLMKGQKKYGNKFLVGIALIGFAIRMAYFYMGGQLLQFVPFSFIPYLFELSLGIYLATVKEINMSKKLLRCIALLALFVFGAGNFLQGFWYFSAFALLVVFLYSYPSLRVMLQNNPLINKFLVYIGSISLYLFLMHGFLRAPLVYYAQSSTFLGKIGYAILFFALSLIFAHLLQWMETKILNGWKNRKNMGSQYFTLNMNAFFSTLSKLMLLIIALMLLSLCCDFLIFPNASLFRIYLFNNIQVITFIFPVICLLGFCLLFCFRKFTLWIILAIFLTYTLFSNIEVLKICNASWFIQSLFVILPGLIVILAGVVWKIGQKYALRMNRVSIITTTVLLSFSLLFIIHSGTADVENQCRRYYQLSKAERIYHSLTPNSKIEQEIVYILTDTKGTFDTANDPEDETQSVVVVNSDRLYQNIFTDNSMPESTQSVEIDIEFQYYPFDFNDETHLTLACDINQSFLQYTNITSSKMKSNQWNEYKTKLFLSKSDGFTTAEENCLILYFYNPHETKFYLRNCKVTARYRTSNPTK